VIDLPRSADVVIVGGGFAGMSTAWALRARGITDVVVVERETDLGRYASGRSAGLGRQLAEDDALTAMTVRGAAVLREKLAHAWTPTGGVLSFDNAEHAQAYVERAARFGIEAVAMSTEMLLGTWPALDAVEIVSALHIPSDGVIDIAALLATYATGIHIVRSTHVTRVSPLSGGARLHTNRGDIVARAVVDAAGAWAGQAFGNPPLASFKRHVYLLDAAPAPDAPYVWHLGACELYLRGAGAETLVSPCDTTLTPAGDQQPDLEGEIKLRRAFAGSSLETAPIARAWACQRTFPSATANPTVSIAGSPIAAMLLGRDAHHSWLVWAAGLGGHGATASAAVGETVADAVAQIL
jgi:glycine/D-amino acid oxidase-like deaminating enzyme